MSANPQMLILARESRGMTQGELANRLECSQGYVSKLEAGIQLIPDELLPALAAHLNYPAEFFLQNDRVFGYGTPCLYHRRQKTIPALVLRRLQALANVVRLHVRNMCRGVEIEFSSDFPRLDIDEFGTPERVAELVRRYWRLASGPITDLVRVVEAAGGIVVRIAFGTRQLDAVSVWAPGEHPLFLINADSPWDRVRFTLAHEVGHMVMHTFPSAEMEVDADRFAAELLMPAEDIKLDLANLRFESLAILKQRWRVSMAALTRRAYTLNCISRDQYRRIFTRFSQKHWRLQEPNPIPSEEPTVVRDIIHTHTLVNGLTLSELALLAQCSEHELRERFMDGGLRLVS